MTTITIDRAVVEQALEALESVLCNPDGKCCIDGSNADRAVVDAALTALRAALAQEQAEPLNLSDPAVRKRLASQWGYVPAAQESVPAAVVGTQSDVWRGYNGQWQAPGEPIKTVQMLRDLPMGTLLYTAPPRCPNCASLESQHAELDDMLVAMKHAVAQAAAVERKACADICDAHASCEGIAERCAADIRARGQA